MTSKSFEEAKDLGIPEEYNLLPRLEALGFRCVRHVDAVTNKKYRDYLGPIPDFLLEDNTTGKLVYLDIKTKDNPAYYFIKKSWRHGNKSISSYRDRAAAEGIPVIVVFYEHRYIKGYTETFTDKRYPKLLGQVSPPIDIGGYWIVNASTPFIGQEGEETSRFKGMCFYDRNTLKPLSCLREVAGLDSN